MGRPKEANKVSETPKPKEEDSVKEISDEALDKELSETEELREVD